MGYLQANLGLLEEIGASTLSAYKQLDHTLTSLWSDLEGTTADWSGGAFQEYCLVRNQCAQEALNRSERLRPLGGVMGEIRDILHGTDVRGRRRFGG
jgi:hypothetical protein